MSPLRSREIIVPVMKSVMGNHTGGIRSFVRETASSTTATPISVCDIAIENRMDTHAAKVA